MRKREVFLKIPRELLKEFIILAVINLGISLVMDASSFLLQFSKDAITKELVHISIWLICFHCIRFTFESFSMTFIQEREDLFQEHMDLFHSNKTNTVLLRVRGKVQHRNEIQGFNEKMPSSKIEKTCKSYLSNTWEIRTFFLKNGIDIFSAVIMFAGLLGVSTLEIEHTSIFVVLVILASILELFFCNKRIKKRNESREAIRKAKIVANEAQQNILTIEPINNEHAIFMNNNCINARQENFSLQRALKKSLNLIRVADSASMSCFSISLIALKIWEVGYSNVNLDTLVSAIALTQIYSQFIKRITGFIHIRETWREISEERKVYENDFDNIFSVYEKQIENDELEPSRLLSLSLPEFRVSYTAANDNQPFELVSNEVIRMYPGEFVILTGATGSGKSTLIKMLTGNLCFDGFEVLMKKESEGAIRTILHQDKTMLGSNSILKEITFGNVDYDREKLLKILCGLHLYQELSEKTDDVLTFLDNSGIDQYSSGQSQRLALARTLMNLDDTVQIVAFDEATNNLNDEIGLMVLKFIKEMCKDKIVLFATHQTNIAYEVATMHLHFAHSEIDMNYHVNMV